MKTTVAALALVVGLSQGALACGVERWLVKVGTDQDVEHVEPYLRQTTIASLSALPAPKNPDARRAQRFSPVEMITYQVSATMVLIKAEADGDYHIVLRDDAGNTMIVEAPDPACADGSKFAPEISAVRQVLDGKFGHFKRLTGLSLPVTVTGVGFFDKLHGQEGVARNGIELHPLLSVTFR